MIHNISIFYKNCSFDVNVSFSGDVEALKPFLVSLIESSPTLFFSNFKVLFQNELIEISPQITTSDTVCYSYSGS